MLSLDEPVAQVEEVEETKQKADVFFVLGGPGSGKGTLCTKLVRNHGFVHLSAGDLLREERDSGSEDAKLINDLIVKGEIVPVEITVNLIKKAMEKKGWSSNKFLIDGFPRNEENELGWREVMGDTVDLKAVIHLDCPEDEMLNRIMMRA